MTSLTKEIVKAAAATGSKYRLADHKVNGLHLRVSPAGVKTYVIMYSDVAGSRRECVVGRADVLALDDARDIARGMLGDRARGVDPLQAKADAREQERKRRTSTLRSFADDWEALQRLKGKRESTRKYEHYLLRKIIIPSIGDVPLAEIRRADVMDLMQKVAVENGPHSSNQVHTLIVMVLNSALERELIVANPALGLRKLYRPQPRERVLSASEIRVLWAALQASACSTPGETTGFHPTTARALQLCLATGQRREEVAGTPWSEIDIDVKLWKLPKERVKNKRSHVVPLSTVALEVLRSCKRANPSSRWVFPSPASSRSERLADDIPLPGMALGRAIGRFATDLGWPNLGPHDLRRTAATRMAEEPISGSPDVIGRILNHAPQGVTRQVYVRADYQPQMRQLLERWSEELGRLMSAERDLTNADE